jgi:hypothetical protein
MAVVELRGREALGEFIRIIYIRFMRYIMEYIHTICFNFIICNVRK